MDSTKPCFTLEEDMRSWEWENNDIYSVRSYYAVCAKERVERARQQYEMAHNSQEWNVFFGRIQTMDKLNTRGMGIHNGCAMCNNEEEIINHFLVSYPVARTLWENFYLLSSRCRLAQLVPKELWWKTWIVALSTRRPNEYMGTLPMLSYGCYGTKKNPKNLQKQI